MEGTLFLVLGVMSGGVNERVLTGCRQRRVDAVRRQHGARARRRRQRQSTCVHAPVTRGQPLSRGSLNYC